MAKIALCLSGLPRSYEKTEEAYRNLLLNKHEVHTFISTWDVVGMKIWYGKYEEQPLDKPKFLEYKDRMNCVSHQILKHESINPIIVKQSESLHSANTKTDPYTAKNVTGMYFQIENCYRLLESYIKETNERYDLVFRSRFDVELKSIPDLRIEPNTCYVPEQNHYATGMNDQVAYGDYETMKVYSLIYSYIPTFYGKYGHIHPETLLRTTLSENGIKVVTVPIEYELLSKSDKWKEPNKDDLPSRGWKWPESRGS